MSEQPNQLKNIDFDAIHAFVQRQIAGGHGRSIKYVKPGQMPSLVLAGEEFPVIGLYASTTGKKPLIPLPEAAAPRATPRMSTKKIRDNHGYYALYFDIRRNGKSLGDIMVEVERGKEKLDICAWNHATGTGFSLGTLYLPPGADALQALARLLETHDLFLNAFGFLPEPHVSPERAVSPLQPPSKARGA